jgi:hypothetical protein
MPYKDLFPNADIKSHFGWELAICQHPMFLLIDEDRGVPVVGERVAPWGAPSAEEYVERVIRNLESLEKYPDLKISYEFSGAEVMGIAEKFPAVVQNMKRQFDRGQLDFVNGTYAQPHLHIFGSESNWRQFETGLGVYKQLFGKQIKTYQAQETGVHLQLPQMLKLFGYDYMVLPDFRWMMSLENGKLEIDGGACQGVDVYLDSADGFVDAGSLDGTTIPTYINSHGAWQGDIIGVVRKDMKLGQKIWIMNPDMIEVNEDQYRDFNAVFTIVLLEDSLRKSYRPNAPHIKAKVFSTWSYVEGVWAEELLRRNKQAEENAVLAENICCLASLAGKPINHKEKIEKIWQGILKYQHHDVHWIEVTNLRQKALDILDEGIHLAHSLTDEAAAALISDKGEQDGKYYTLLNALPRQRVAPVELDAALFSGGSAFQQFKGRLIGALEVPAYSAKSFPAQGAPAGSSATVLPASMRTPDYAVTFSADGLMEQISAAGQELLRPGEYVGGELRCMAGDAWHNNRKAECAYYTGPLFDTLERRHAIAGVPTVETYFFYKTLPLIKAELEFDFNGNEIGNFWADYSKLNAYFPTSGREVYHDIPFGWQEGKPDRPLYATNWIYSGGLVYVNRGNAKHWVSEGVLANMLAWGGTVFDNRMHFNWTDRGGTYDLRLYGKRKITYFLIPAGNFDGNRIARDVESAVSPLYAAPGKADIRFHAPLNKDLIVTALHEKDNEVYARGYQLPGGGIFRDFEIFDRPLKELAGNS